MASMAMDTQYMSVNFGANGTRPIDTTNYFHTQAQFRPNIPYSPAPVASHSTGASVGVPCETDVLFKTGPRAGIHGIAIDSLVLPFYYPQEAFINDSHILFTLRLPYNMRRLTSTGYPNGTLPENVYSRLRSSASTNWPLLSYGCYLGDQNSVALAYELNKESSAAVRQLDLDTFASGSDRDHEGAIDSKTVVSSQWIRNSAESCPPSALTSSFFVDKRWKLTEETKNNEFSALLANAIQRIHIANGLDLPLLYSSDEVPEGITFDSSPGTYVGMITIREGTRYPYYPLPYNGQQYRDNIHRHFVRNLPGVTHYNFTKTNNDWHAIHFQSLINDPKPLIDSQKMGDHGFSLGFSYSLGLLLQHMDIKILVKTSMQGPSPPSLEEYIGGEIGSHNTEQWWIIDTELKLHDKYILPTDNANHVDQANLLFGDRRSAINMYHQHPIRDVAPGFSRLADTPYTTDQNFYWLLVDKNTAFFQGGLHCDRIDDFCKTPGDGTINTSWTNANNISHVNRPWTLIWRWKENAVGKIRTSLAPKKLLIQTDDLPIVSEDSFTSASLTPNVSKPEASTTKKRKLDEFPNLISSNIRYPRRPDPALLIGANSRFVSHVNNIKTLKEIEAANRTWFNMRTLVPWVICDAYIPPILQMRFVTMDNTGDIEENCALAPWSAWNTGPKHLQPNIDLPFNAGCKNWSIPAMLPLLQHSNASSSREEVEAEQVNETDPETAAALEKRFPITHWWPNASCMIQSTELNYEEQRAFLQAWKGKKPELPSFQWPVSLGSDFLKNGAPDYASTGDRGQTNPETTLLELALVSNDENSASVSSGMKTLSHTTAIYRDTVVYDTVNQGAIHRLHSSPALNSLNVKIMLEDAYGRQCVAVHPHDEPAAMRVRFLVNYLVTK